MDPHAFLTDLEAIPATLAALARTIDAGGVRWPVDEPPRRILLTGMGSSWYAASVIASRLRSAGLDAVAELASNELTWPAAPDLLVVAISATGGSVETLAALEPHAGTSRVVALTNVADSAVTERVDRVDHVVAMHAGREAGGVACRTYRHTIATLAVLAEQLGTLPAGSTAVAVRRAATASEYLLDRRDAWLPEVLMAVDSPDGTWFLAPAERSSSALQGALMVREGPRRRADGCETGDWSHVDVYLTKTLDYRALVFAGSRYDAAAAEWMTSRRSTSVAVSGSFPGATFEVRYPGDDDPLVALLTETLVAELVAATWWT